MSQTLSAIGGTPPYTWTAIDTLPAGLSLSSAGVLSGAPTVEVAGAYYTIQVTDSASNTATLELWITVLGAAVPVPPVVEVLRREAAIVPELEVFIQSPAAMPIFAIVPELEVSIITPVLINVALSVVPQLEVSITNIPVIDIALAIVPELEVSITNIPVIEIDLPVVPELEVLIEEQLIPVDLAIALELEILISELALDFMPYTVITATTDYSLLKNNGYVLNLATSTATVNLFLPLTSTLTAGDRIEFYPIVGKANIKNNAGDLSFKYKGLDVSTVRLDNEGIVIGLVYSGSALGWLPQFKYDLSYSLYNPDDGIDFNNVKLLLHGEGSNGGSTFTDHSGLASTITRGGTPVTSTAQFKFGSSAIAFNGSTDYLILPNNDALSPDTGNWTFESWVYMTAAGRYSWLNLHPSSPTFSNSTLQLYLDSTNGFYLDDSNTGGSSGSGGFSLNAWHYIVISRSGTSSVQGWIDGVRRLNTTSAANYGTPLAQARIGVDKDGTAFFPGYLDEIRLTIGQSKDGSIVPTAAFPDA